MTTASSLYTTYISLYLIIGNSSICLEVFPDKHFNYKQLTINVIILF